jgi:hypothetical protein
MSEQDVRIRASNAYMFVFTLYLIGWSATGWCVAAYFSSMLFDLAIVYFKTKGAGR